MERTTVRLNENLLDEAKNLAAKRGQTLTELISDSLRATIKESKNPRRKKRVRLATSNTKGGTWPGIDITNSASLFQYMEEKG
jgi:metal-responsive CopG/Arc/MetJ family transcriptional regulator